MDTDAYLKRIEYRGSVAPTAETLRQLQVAHLRAIPFENLSIHAREPIVLDDEALFEKVVRRRRGGFCYELNGLFASMLRMLGFNVSMLSAAVARNETAFGPAFDHMTLMVTFEERWLADVGFGDSFREPLRLDSREEQVQGRRAFRVDVEGELYFLRQRESDGKWINLFRFALEPYTYADFAAMCRYHQTSPESHFTQRRVCSRAKLEGRVTLSEMLLITTQNGKRYEQELEDETAYAEALCEHFGIVMDDPLNKNAIRMCNGERDIAR